MSSKLKWYHEGLRFACTGCGKCCTGAPGYVWVSEEEIALIADHLGLSIAQMRQNYIRQVGDRLALVEQAEKYDCVFLRGKECSIYPARPMQCQTYPFWPENLRSKEDWDNTAIECEGIRDDAPLIACATIDKECLRHDETTDGAST